MDKQRILHVENLSHSYKQNNKEIKALTNINLDIYQGEFVCVLGPSGCGKSTLLNILAGFLIPREGKAYIKEKLIKSPDKERGVMFQSNTLYPWLNVAENIEFGPKLQGMAKPKLNALSQKLLKELGLEDFAKAQPYDLSGGMRQRVAMARALANDPEILLMDEPFGALDAMTRRKMQVLIRGLWIERKTTIFLITHDIDEALALATKILLFTPAPGTIAQEFNIGYTYQAYENPKGRVKADDRYLEIKEEILDFIEP